MPPTTTTSTAIFCASGSLLSDASASCAVRATSMLLGRVVHAAVDFPVDRAGIGLLRRLLDGNLGKELRGLQLLHERGKVLIGDGVTFDGRLAALLVEIADPDARRNERRHLVEDLDGTRAALLQGVEDLELVLERLLVLGDGLHFSDGLLQLRDLRAGPGDLAVHLG